MFKPLTKDNIGHIITLLMADLNKRLVDKEITVELTDTAKQFITDNGYDPVYGARHSRDICRSMSRHSRQS